MGGSLSKKWREAQGMVDAQTGYRKRSGLEVNSISKIWEQMRNIWKEIKKRSEVK